MKKRVTFDSSRLEEQLLAAGEDILDVSETLNAQLVNITSKDKDFDESSLEEDFQKMVISTSTVVRLADEWFDLSQEDVLIGLISPLSKKVRTSVLNYVPATKACFANSMDFLTKNVQKHSFLMVDKYTRGLCAIVEILHRKRLRGSGLSFGTIDPMDAECILLIKIANNLTTESRHIITLAMEGDPLEILTSSETFLRAMDDFLDNIKQYNLSQAKDEMKRLRGQHQAIISLSQDAKRANDGSGQLSDDDVTERGANISLQLVDCTIELVLFVVKHFQKQWQELIDSEAPVEIQPHEPLKDDEDKPIGPRRPQKPARTKSGKDLTQTISPNISPNRSKARSVRLDYERKYGLQPSYLDTSEPIGGAGGGSQTNISSTRKDRASTFTPVTIRHSGSIDEELSSIPTRSQTISQIGMPESPKRSKASPSMGKRSSEPAVQQKPPSFLNSQSKKRKRKRKSFTLRLRSDSKKESTPDSPNALTVQYVEAPDEAEQKLNELFDHPESFLTNGKNTSTPPIESGLLRTSGKKRNGKKRRSQGKSLPEVPAGDMQYLRSAPSRVGSSRGVPVFRTLTTFVPKLERSGSSKEFDLSDMIRKTNEEQEKESENQKVFKKPNQTFAKSPLSPHKQKETPPTTPAQKAGIPENLDPTLLRQEQKQKIAMAAAMAASVPIVIDLFHKEFSWFSKEWDRLPMSNKTKFTTKMRNELVTVNNFEVSQPSLKPISDPVKHVKLQRQASFNPLNSLRSQIKEKKDQDDLEGMMVPLSSKVRWFHRSTSLSNVLTEEDAENLRKTEKSIREAVQVVSDVIEEFIDHEAPIKDKPPHILSAKVVDIYKVLTRIIKLSTGSADNKIVRQMVVPTLDLISSASTQGTTNDTLVNTLKESLTFAQVHTTLTDLRMNIYDKLQNLSALMAQIAYTVLCVDVTMKKISHADTLQLIAGTRAMADTISTTLNVLSTYSHIRTTLTEDKCNKMEKLHAQQPCESIWDFKPLENEKIGLCSLDYFIIEITNPFNKTPEREEQEKTFILTFQTACSSVTLYEKLIDRYSIPGSTQASSDEISATQKLVCEILLHWVQEQFDNISKSIICKILESVDRFMKDGHQLLAANIKQTIQQKMKDECLFFNQSFKIKEAELQRSSDALNLYETFLRTEERTIAEQLTLMDFKIFRRIQHSELLDQAWNKNKHCAVNVIDHITRLNHVSYWVPSLILWSEKVKQRGEVLWKFICIGQELLKLHNYNTLMGLVAGLNMSSITRLKYTSGVLPDHQTDILNQLIDLFDPSRSFKVYREHIARAERPVIPYLGVYLTDLTFIDEGNPNKKNDLINFAKRFQIGKVLEQIRHFQEVEYSIESDPMLSIYLKELAFLDDEGLYQLSLTREPRNAEMFDIL